MIKRFIEYLVIERRTEYIQYESSLKSGSARDCTNYSTLKATSIRISTSFFSFLYSIESLMISMKISKQKNMILFDYLVKKVVYLQSTMFFM